MPPVAGPACSLSYRAILPFGDGMIHDSWCPPWSAELHHAVQLHRVVNLLVTGSSRVHRRRWRSQALVNKQLDLNATVLRTSFTRVIVGNRVDLAKAKRRNDATQWNAVVLDEVTDNCIRTTLAQLAIQVDAAS